MITKKINFPEVRSTCFVMHHDTFYRGHLDNLLFSDAEINFSGCSSLPVVQVPSRWVLGEVAGPGDTLDFTACVMF